MNGEEVQVQTGDIVPVSEKNFKVLETFNQERKDLGAMFNTLAHRQRISDEGLWNTVRDLYPELKGFDLRINWKKKEITVRYKKREEEV